MRARWNPSQDNALGLGSAPNQAFKLTRLSACHVGGLCSVESAAAHWLCPSPAVQLNAGVGPLHDRGAITLDNIIALRYGFRG